MTRGNGGWQLGIDFGTSYTVAAVASSRGIAVLDVESNGQSRMPSSVFYTEAGEILVGTAAQHQSAFAPERFEATPKRSIADGEIFLGDEFIGVTTLIAGVLRKVYTEASRQHGETLPQAVRLTHPADWGEARLELLREAAAKASLPAVELVPEPVAAAVWIAGAVTRPGERIAVYDFGGGTFDAAVLRRTADGFEVAGPPAGRDPLGGEDIDRRIVDFIGSVVQSESPEDWASLTNPRDVTWRRRSIALRMEVQRAKETLSEVTSCQLWIPGLERELQLTRAELEELISGDLDECTQTLLTALHDASVTAGELQGLYLVGGSSRIPVVAEKLWRRLGVAPSVQDSPKSVVALGAARWTDIGAELTASAQPSERSVVTVADAAPLAIVRHDRAGNVVVPPSLVLTLPPQLSAWRAGATTYQLIDRVRGGPPATIRLRDEPRRAADAKALAVRAGNLRASRSATFVDHGVRPWSVLGQPGLERSFTVSPRGVPIAMLERYVVAGDRALVMAFPAEQAALADTVSSAGWPAAGGRITAPVALLQPPGWTTSEEIRLVDPDGSRIVRAERTELLDEPEEAWRWHRLESSLRDAPEAGVAGRATGRVMGRLPGEIVTVRWRTPAAIMLTKLGTATAAGHGFVLTLTLPLAQQADFPMFAGLLSVDAATQSATP